jgi:hypothetical protein
LRYRHDITPKARRSAGHPICKGYRIAHHRTSRRLVDPAGSAHMVTAAIIEPPRGRAHDFRYARGRSPDRGVVDGLGLCRMFNPAIRRQTPPKYLSSDHDPLYRFHQWRANLRVLQVREIKTVPYVPLSHPFVERMIGTIRREYLDQTLFWTAGDLFESDANREWPRVLLPWEPIRDG